MNEEYFFSKPNESRDSTRKIWFDMALDDISNHTNQVIVNGHLKFERKNKPDGNTHSSEIDSVFYSLKN